MKILKGIFIAILGLAAVYLIACFFTPNKIQVEKSISIKAPADLIYATATDFHTWDNWSSWNLMDSNLQSQYSEETGTVGAWTSWKSEVVGNGRQEITEVKEPNYAKFALNFESWSDTSYSVLQIEEVGTDSSRVIYSMDGAEMPFYWGPVILVMNPVIESNFTKSLEGLKSYTETQAEKQKEKTAELLSDIQVVQMEAIPILAIKDSTNSVGISNKLEELYTEISRYIASTEGLEQAGMPLAIYHYYSEDRVILEAGIPYMGPAEETGRIKMKQTPSGNTVKKIHYGSYASSEISHEEIYNFIETNGYQMLGSPWEVYANDPSMVSESEIQTNIYYPIK